MLMHTQDMMPFKRKRNLHRNIKRFYKKYSIYQRKINEFKEVEGEELVKEIDGFYFNNISTINRKVDDYGKFITGRSHYIQTSEIDGISSGMFAVVDGKRYEIIDIEDEAGLGLSYVLTLEDKILYTSKKG